MTKRLSVLGTFLCLLFSSLAVAQVATIKGQVLSLKEGQAISGVNVLLNEQQGTVSDTAGFFELSISQFPTRIRFSHIAHYSQETLLSAPTDTLLVIVLEPKTTDLEEVVVSAQTEVKPLSEADKYSVYDFETAGDYILRLEFHSSFKPYRLSLVDGEGELYSELVLSKIKGIEGLYRGCNEDLYLVTSGLLYAVGYTNGQLALEKTLDANTFEDLIQPCQLFHQQKLYYLLERDNGLRQIIKSYDLESKEVETLRSIGDEEQIANYHKDVSYIQRSAQTVTMMIDDYDTNLAKRRFQADGEFLSRVFYRPDFPVMIMAQGEAVLIFNHSEGQLEVYREGKFKEAIPLAYVEADNWVKNIAIDRDRQEAYALFEKTGQTRLDRIDTTTGEATVAAIIDTAPGRLLKLRLFKGELYYLTVEYGQSNRRVLYGQRM